MKIEHLLEYIRNSKIKPVNIVVFAVAGFMFLFTMKSIFKTNQPQARPVVSAPSSSPYSGQLAGLGVVEPASKFLKLAPNISGIVMEINVVEGQEVKKGDVLFSIDDREAKAQKPLAEARLEAAKLNEDELKTNLEIYERLYKKENASFQEINARRFAHQKAKAQLKEAEANLNLINTNIERLSVFSPIDGTILKINLARGEFASFDSTRDNIIVGDLKNLHVRVSIDESDFSRFSQSAKAVAVFSGNQSKKASLSFIRLEPYAMPKSNISGSSSEKIDTRVVEIIYKIDDPKFAIIPGQEVDVYIQS
jgi:HlyD family secretion protein